MAFELPALPYAYDALEPFYDKETLEIHHSKHHQTYTTKFNEAVQAAGLEGQSVIEILKGLEQAPAAQRAALTNHGGGYYNHAFFWECMGPKGGQPDGDLAAALNQKFGSFDAFKEAFNAKAVGHFGSGWAWLVLDQAGELAITDTHDQVSPISLGHVPLLTIDVWEHAYYLKYRNARPEWVNAYWNIINWDKVTERFAQAK